MAIVNTGFRAFANKLPKVISPRQHAIIDYATAGAFGLGAVLFWKNHKRAAIASLVCGAAEAGTAMMTDFPGGLVKVIPFELHGKIDVGLAAGLEAIPTLLAFSDDPRAWFFRGQGLSIAAVTGMTDFRAGQRRSETRRRQRIA
jgi:hypothetical protein